jgi:hypothetical protein
MTNLANRGHIREAGTVSTSSSSTQARKTVQ